jgi:hypothetical protein
MTQIAIDEHSRIPTTDARLIRRMFVTASTGIVTCNYSKNVALRNGGRRRTFFLFGGRGIMFNSALSTSGRY